MNCWDARDDILKYLVSYNLNLNTGRRVNVTAVSMQHYQINPNRLEEKSNLGTDKKDRDIMVPRHKLQCVSAQEVSALFKTT